MTQNKALFHLIAEAPLKTEITVKQKMARKLERMNYLTMHHLVYLCPLLLFNAYWLRYSNTLHLCGSSSGKRWVISWQMKCRTEASLFLPVTTTVSKRAKLQTVWGSSHILLSSPFLTYMFQSRPPARRWATEGEHSSYHFGHLLLSSIMLLTQTWWKRVFHLASVCPVWVLANWNFREHENQTAHSRTGTDGKWNHMMRNGYCSALQWKPTHS